ncbi:hypothetical protein AVEN_187245-1 [Araneus ventricosus]|uniref:Uncharacterized protein n=1 Tax=Araneus ventricosus TaxID=182803 RepID=A0A4Y2MR12_ARAVE|nr:hypothetical protein AVEN_187245-1 [Araneus ventricosus]
MTGLTHLAWHAVGGCDHVFLSHQSSTAFENPGAAWFDMVACFGTSITKMSSCRIIDSNAIVPFPQSWPTFSQIVTSVTEHPLPPAMREFKTNQASTVHPASSSISPSFSLEMEGLVSPVQHSTSPPLQPIIP